MVGREGAISFRLLFKCFHAGEKEEVGGLYITPSSNLRVNIIVVGLYAFSYRGRQTFT